MSNVSITIKLDQKCNGICGCKKRPNLRIKVEEEPDQPVKGYLKCIHKANGGTLILKFKYKDETIYSDWLYEIGDVKEVSVYYGGPGLDIPFVIEIEKRGGSFTCSYNENPEPGSRNTVWAQNDDLSDHKKLLDKLEELSCRSTGTVVLDIYKKDPQRYFCDTKVSLSSNRLLGDENVYEFKQSSNKTSFKVPYLRYDGKDVNTNIPSEIKGISTFYWKYNFGRPLVLKVENKSGEVEYRFNNGRNKWEKKTAKEVGNLVDAISEHNCKRNRAITIDLGQIHGEYCCTKKCPNKRIIVKENSIKEIFTGFTSYEHKGIRGYSFTIDKIISNTEKQKGIKYPIRDVYELTVYYCTRCDREPIFIYMGYELDGSMEYAWYKRVTKNGWDIVLDMPENEEDFYKSLKEHLEKLSGLLGDTCNLSGFQDDNMRFYTKKDDKIPASPEESYTQVVKNAKSDSSPLPKGPPLDEKEEEKEAQEEDSRSRKRQNITPLLHPKPGKPTYPSVQKLQQIKQRVESTSPPQLLTSSHGVIIDIQKSPDNGNSTYKISPSNEYVKVTKETNGSPGSGFLKFTHTKNNAEGQSFQVEKAIFGKDAKSVDSGVNSEKIEYISVWYWNKDQNLNNPLLTEVKKSDKTIIYRYNKGGTGFGWNKLPGRQDTSNFQLQGEALEQTLDDLNCSLNNAVTMDISYDKGGRYCCNKHGSVYKVSTSSHNITITSSSITNSTTTSIPYQKHEIRDGITTKLVKMKYYFSGDNLKNTRKRITATTGLLFPIDGPVSVYVFYCKENPAIIYVDPKGISSQNAKGWYKKDPSGDNRPWTKFQGELPGNGPENITKCGKEFNELVKVLRESGGCNYGECTDTHKQALVSVEQDPGVIIELSKKPTGTPNTKEYDAYSTGSGKITVTVTITEQGSGGSDFLKFVHTQKDGPSFKLSQVLDDNSSPIKGIEGTNIGSVASYYWKHETTKNPLFIEVQDGGGNYTYYANSKTYSWKKYTESVGKPLDESQLTQKLTLLNCDLNDVVQIDVTKTSEYCHDIEYPQVNHTKNRIKVTETGQGYLGNYTAYAHSPSNGGRFNISGFRNGSTPIKLENLQLPLKTNRVLVYFCKSEVSARTTNPLLIYFPDASGYKWFKKSTTSTTWDSAKGLKGRDEKSYAEIIKTLDTLTSACKPPEVTIDLYNRSRIGESTIYGGDSYSVAIGYITYIQGFTEYKHTVYGRNYFTLSKLVYGQGRDITGVIHGSARKLVRSVSVYYWTPLEQDSNWGNKSKPLLLKMSLYNGGDKYYENISKIPTDSTEWTEWRSNTYISPEDICNKLYLLNCSLNNSVIIDVSQKDNPGHYDACEDDRNLDNGHSNNDKMQVSKDSDKSLGSYDSYTHTLADNSVGKFHIVNFINNGPSRKTLKGIDVSYTTPILDVGQVKVYFCPDDPNKPLLLYIKTSDPKFGSKKWWKYNGNKTWQEVTQDPPSDTKRYDWIRGVLNELNSQCKPQDVASSGPVAAARDAGPHGPGSPPWDVISGVLTGVGVVSGSLTGFGWWLYKRSKGDPWVRQI
ncbi:hypothetical protein BEWA_054090 [Theileria equi strain WA]|uniref:Uncharacterized protein n=1 Tax=Theileria equi strain WA TaxID=1537102 RepID=L1LDX9_THEEQ|nr:hypothetical protein BEWA_054090 [Theileria equi strain WA]EKX73353.1 hypothetical protein BEWA_054090 [Theileria equi strain WA]|eukprot:XP_004832805.1 hypothetical protein BEWA_054090 [Theileria equi strain WA]